MMQSLLARYHVAFQVSEQVVSLAQLPSPQPVTAIRRDNKGLFTKENA